MRWTACSEQRRRSCRYLCVAADADTYIHWPGWVLPVCTRYRAAYYCTVYRSAAAHRMMRDDFVSIKTQATIRPYTQQNEKYESAKQKYAKNNKRKCKSANFASRTVLARCASAHASRESTRRSACRIANINRGRLGARRARTAYPHTPRPGRGRSSR